MPSVLCFIVLGCVLLVGCAPAASSASVARTNQVDLPPSYKFEPAHIQVVAGSSVTWTNHDNFTHTVQLDGQSEVRQIRPGERISVLFDAPGEYHYVRTLHTQNMQGTVSVS
jgi:plastocyanin